MRIAVFASGSGTNLQSLLDAATSAQVVLVLTDRPGCFAVQRARRAGVPIAVVPWEGDRTLFTKRILAEVQQAGVEAMVLAGFMRILGPEAVEQYPNRIVNIHPSLLPAFPGVDAVGQALTAGVDETGVTVHFVDELVDHGPIIEQRSLKIRPTDDRDSLHARLQAIEHDLYPRVVNALADGRLEVVEGQVVWS